MHSTPLQNEWSFWEHRKQNVQKYNTYSTDLYKLGDFNSVETFWQFKNNIPQPSNIFYTQETGEKCFPDRKIESYSMFKKGIKPEWEDPANGKGGEIFVRGYLTSENLDKYWELLCLGLIGETIDPEDEICGIRIVDKTRICYKKETIPFYRIELWFRNNDQEKIKIITENTCTLLEGNVLNEYRTHDPKNFKQVSKPVVKNFVPKPKLPPRSENAWVPGKKGDDHEQAVKNVKSILNKLAEKNFDKLTEKIKNIPVTSLELLYDITKEIYEKALDEQNFSELYAKLCKSLFEHNTKRPWEFVKIERKGNGFYWLDNGPFSSQKIAFMDAIKNTNFKRVLLRNCQIEFENKESPKRRMLGNIRFIGELFKKDLINETIIHKCIIKLISNPENDNVESLCKLLTTVGKKLTNDDDYFEFLTLYSNHKEKEARFRFMAKDLLELKEHNWIPRNERY